MKNGGILDGIRIGCVKYLNARPLIGAYPGPVVFEHPSALAKFIWNGDLEAGLVPVFEAFQHPGYAAVDGVGICSDGPVYSVFLAHRVPLKEVRSVCLDTASLTSVNLLRVLCAEFFGIAPRTDAACGDPDARLLIGNQAIDFRMRNEPGWQILDLGEAWKQCTGLPFVYAVWLLRPGIGESGAVADAFRALKVEGVQRLEEWIQADSFQTEAFRRQYLGGHIRYTLGPDEKRGLTEFRRLLEKGGLIPAGGAALEFI